MTREKIVNQGDNMDGAAARAQAVVEAMVLAYHRLTREAEALHGALGLTAGGRSILLTLEREGPRSVADLARRRDVSRQFMQRTVQGLIAAGHLAEQANPRHRRSPLLTLTEGGRAAVARMTAAEAPLWAEVGRALDPADTDAALRVLGRLAGREAGA